MMKNPKYMNAEGTIILLELDDEGSDVLVAEPTGGYADIFAEAVEGAYGNIAPYVAPEPDPITAQQVKDEAYRRIVAICPEWKQRNLTAQAAILAEKGRANWTADELAAWDAGEAIWQQIAAVRAASDVLEAMDPIPDDYASDEHWP